MNIRYPIYEGVYRILTLNNTNLTRNYKLFAIDVLPTPRIGHDISLNYRFGFCSIGPDIQS